MLKLDAMFNLLGALMFFIISLLAQINPPATPPVEQPGDIFVNIVWPQGPADVDLWVQAPGDDPIGYSNKSGKVWSLLRDDLGVTQDQTPLNFESAFTRGMPDGEYVANVRCYSCGGQVPIDVHVEVRTAKGALIWAGVVQLVADKQEVTAVRWKMAAGKAVPGSENFVFKPMKRGV